MLTTYAELVSHLLDYCSVDPSDESERFARIAIQRTVNSFPQMRHWSYYYSPYFKLTDASQTSSTIVYDHTGGAYERMVTIASGTWPSWAALGVLRIGQVDYEVAERKTGDTIITLSTNSNPGADVAAGTSYTLYRNAYPLPNDFMSLGGLTNQSNQTHLNYIQPADWQDHAVWQYGPAMPVSYTIMGSRNYLNTMTLFLWPAPDSAYSLAGLYQRKLRPVLVTDYIEGTATVTASSTTVTGTGTTWTTRMEGSVIRFGSSLLTPPTGIGGTDPFEVERVITDVASTTSLTIDAVTGTAYTAVKYRISDPIDIREGTMQTFFMRECEKQMRIIRRIEVTKEERAEYEQAKVLAFESDCSTFEPQMVGGSSRVAELPLRYQPAIFP